MIASFLMLTVVLHLSRGPSVDLPPPQPGAAKAAVVSLGGPEGRVLGVHARAATIKAIAPILRDELGTEPPPLLVLRVDADSAFLHSGELEEFAGALDDLKQEFRVVCWIDLALSAAVLPIYSAEEFLFTSQGNFGLTSHGSLVRGPQTPVHASISLDKHLLRAQRLSQLGKRDEVLLRKFMLTHEALSVSRDGKNVLFFDDPREGEIVVKNAGEPMCLNAALAIDVGLSSGTAGTLRQLTIVLGYEKLDWVGDRTLATRREPWPVCRAERYVREERKSVRARLDKLEVVMRDLRASAEDLQSKSASERAAGRERIRESLRELRETNRNDPHLVEWLLDPNTFDEIESKFAPLAR